MCLCLSTANGLQQNKSKGPSKAEKEDFERTAIEFGEHLANYLRDKDGQFFQFLY